MRGLFSSPSTALHRELDCLVLPWFIFGQGLVELLRSPSPLMYSMYDLISSDDCEHWITLPSKPGELVEMWSRYQTCRCMHRKVIRLVYHSLNMPSVAFSYLERLGDRPREACLMDSCLPVVIRRAMDRSAPRPPLKTCHQAGDAVDR